MGENGANHIHIRCPLDVRATVGEFNDERLIRNGEKEDTVLIWQQNEPESSSHSSGVEERPQTKAHYCDEAQTLEQDSGSR